MDASGRILEGIQSLCNARARQVAQARLSSLPNMRRTYEGWRSMRLTRRGKRVVAAILIIVAAITIVNISTHLWWDGAGYCWGNVDECLREGK